MYKYHMSLFSLRETQGQEVQGIWNDRWKVSCFEESFEVIRKRLYVKYIQSGKIRDGDESLKKNYIASLVLKNFFNNVKLNNIER